MTPYALLRDLCGLSMREAAAFHGVRDDTVKSWSTGRRNAPATVLAALRDLACNLDEGAARHAATLATIPADAEIEIGYPADDHEAQALGLPCVGAWAAMFARALASLERPVTLVPRGSTPATAKAVDVHGR